jgi:predicted double-glycine peptidase
MKDAQVAKQVEYRKNPSKVTTALLNNRTDNMVEMTITNNLTNHTVVITTKKNVHEMIADDYPLEIAPTRTRAVRAAQAITTKMVQRSTMTKRNIRSYNNTWLHTAPPKFSKLMQYNSNAIPQ